MRKKNPKKSGVQQNILKSIHAMQSIKFSLSQNLGQVFKGVSLTGKSNSQENDLGVYSILTRDNILPDQGEKASPVNKVEDEADGVLRSGSESSEFNTELILRKKDSKNQLSI